MSRVSLVAAVVLVLSSLTACASQSETADRVRDRASSNPTTDICGGDGGEDDDAGEGSITSVETEHGETEVRVRVGLRELDPRIEQNVEVTFATPGGAWSYEVDRWLRRDGSERIHTFFSPEDTASYPDPDELDPCTPVMFSSTGARCPGAHGEVDVDGPSVVAVVPRPCLENPESVKVGVSAHFVDGHDIVGNDEWTAFTDKADPWLPPLSDPFKAPGGAPIGCQEREQRHQDPPGPGQVVVMGPLICIR